MRIFFFQGTPLQKAQKLYWDATLDKLFNESKTKIISQIKEGVHAFEKDRVTCLSTDWSKAGIGYCLSQKHCSCTGAATPTCGDGHWHLILAGSRFTKPAESRYAPIEGEALGIVYGLQQCKAFVMGCPKLIVAVDHKPLTRILNDRPLETIENPRLLRLKEKTLAYNYDIIHIAGKKNCGPDAISRYPTRSAAVHTRHAGEDDDETHKELSRCAAAFARSQSATLPASITWDEVNNAAMADDECTELRNVIENGFPKMRRQLPESLRYYWSMRKELYVIDNVSFKGRKMLIPKILRKRVLEGLHAAHQGVNGIQANAKERLFWPGLSADITQRRNQCKPCNENAPSQPEEPIIITPDPKIPFEHVVSDLYQKAGRYYHIYADRLSGWTEVAKIPCPAFRHVKKNLQTWFQTYGVPEEISSDGGPPYSSKEYDDFLENWGIKKRLSSAHYPQSNGRTEVAVKTMKRTLQENVSSISGDIDTYKAVRAIITHRNTPSQESGVSPAELLFGYKLRDHLPNKFQKTRKDWHSIHRARENKIREKRTTERASGKVLRPLKVGDAVRIQNQIGNHPKKWSSTGKVVEVRPHRQYKVMKDGSRRVTLRNRKFLRKTNDGDRVSRHPELPKQVVKKSIQSQVLRLDKVRSPTAQQSQESPQSRVLMPPVSPGPQSSDQHTSMEGQEVAVPEILRAPRRHQGAHENPLQESDMIIVQPPCAEAVGREDGSLRRSGRSRSRPKRLLEEC